MMMRWFLVSLLVLVCACRRSPESAGNATAVKAQMPPRSDPPFASGDPANPDSFRRTPHREKSAPLPSCSSRTAPLAAARSFYDKGKYDEALACAAQASAVMPHEPQAHSEHAAALAALGMYDEARVAYSRALALNPNEVDALLGAAHLYAVTLPSNRDRDELASLYAEKGLELAEVRTNAKLRAQFALLSAMAFNDLGRARDALERADGVLTIEPGNSEAHYERSVALFELCRFSEAKAAFNRLLTDKEHGAHAHHHLGLLLEREHRWTQAEEHFEAARKMAPSEFWTPQLLSKEEFAAEVAKAVSELPADMQRDLRGVPVAAEDLPSSTDLTSGDPPLSPAILGLFRGPPLGEACTPAGHPPCRSVALYRRNLARVAKTRGELLKQVRLTLHHEIGHLRGEDDLELAARGLE
jgi:tetratricopeptide (TPR) repeat protein